MCGCLRASVSTSRGCRLHVLAHVRHALRCLPLAAAAYMCLHMYGMQLHVHEMHRGIQCTRCSKAPYTPPRPSLRAALRVRAMIATRLCTAFHLVTGVLTLAALPATTVAARSSLLHRLLVVGILVRRRLGGSRLLCSRLLCSWLLCSRLFCSRLLCGRLHCRGWCLAQCWNSSGGCQEFVSANELQSKCAPYRCGCRSWRGCGRRCRLR